MKIVSKIIGRVPISLFLLTVIINLLLFYGVIEMPYDDNYSASDKFSFGIYEITNTIFTLFLGLTCYRLKLCYYNWVSVVGLLLLNIINLFAILFEMNMAFYYALGMNVIILFMAVLAIALFFKRI